MILKIGLGLGCFFSLRVGFVLDYEIFLGMHPAILDTLGLNKRKHSNFSPISQIKTSLLIALNPNSVIDKILIPIQAIYNSNKPQAQ